MLSRLRGVLLGESVPDPRTALLGSALDGGGPSELCVPRGRVEEADRHAEEVRKRTGEVQRAIFSAAQQA